MEIRKAIKNDFKELAEILKEESSKEPYNEKYTLQSAIKEIKGLAKNELFVAVSNNKILGFIASHINSDDKSKAYITELWLDSQYQGKGIGTKLMEFIERKHKKKSAEKIRILVKRTTRAFGFYKNLGYSEYNEMVFVEKELR